MAIGLIQRFQNHLGIPSISPKFHPGFPPQDDIVSAIFAFDPANPSGNGAGVVPYSSGGDYGYGGGQVHKWSFQGPLHSGFIEKNGDQDAGF